MSKKIASTAMIVLIINIISRGFALVANSLITATIGVNDMTSAYSYALSLTNIITTIIGTTLTTSVIPIYTDLKENHDLKRANGFINNTISLTVIVSVVLVIIGSVLAPYIFKISGNSDVTFGVFAIRVLLWSIVFICLYYVFSGLLNANDKFYLAAMVSLPSSFVSIIYLAFLSKDYGAYGLTFATVTGFFLQAAILVPALKSTNFKFKLSFDYKNEDMYKIFKVVTPVIVGVCAYQINMLTNNSIAFAYDSERYIVLNNAQNLGIQIVMTLVLAIASVVYPKLSQSAAKEETEEFKNIFTGAVNGMTLILIPIAFAYYIFSKEVMDLIYGYGKFTEEYISLGGNVFAMYAFSILGIGFKEITDRAFYAMKNTKTSAYNGVLIMVVNILLSAFMVKIYGLAGIAIAYSIAALIGGINILLRFKSKHKYISLKPIFITVIKSFISCVVMAIIVYFIKDINFGEGKINLLLKLGISGIVGAVSYFVMLVVLKTNEIKGFLKKGKLL